MLFSSLKNSMKDFVFILYCAELILIPLLKIGIIVNLSHILEDFYFLDLCIKSECEKH